MSSVERTDSNAESADASGASDTSDTLIRAKALYKSFGATQALDGASVSVHAGEVVAVMGPSGSGKSTLLHCVSGIVAADSGDVYYGDYALSGLSDSARTSLRRSEFGFVFQFGQLVPELPCVENVALPLRLDGIRTRRANASAERVMRRLGVDDIAAQRPGEVSGGQAQRVAVARALVTEPKLIFADEPTGALDSLNGERVMEQLVESARAGGAAVVLVTHDVRVAAYADREVIVRDGRTREFGGGV